MASTVERQVGSVSKHSDGASSRLHILLKQQSEGSFSFFTPLFYNLQVVLSPLCLFSSTRKQTVGSCEPFVSGTKWSKKKKKEILPP